MKLRQTLVLGPCGCTCCLRGCPFLGGRHALRRRWVCLDAAWYPRLERFCRRRTCTSFSQEKAKRPVTSYVFRSIVVSTKPGWYEGVAKVRRCKAMRAAGINVYQGKPWNEALDGKEVHGAAWWRVRSGVEGIRFFLHTYLVPPPLQNPISG